MLLSNMINWIIAFFYFLEELGFLKIENILTKNLPILLICRGPGHKIRVVISSSNYPRFAKNPNTGAPLARDYLNFNIANNTLLVGPLYNSSIILPRLVNMSSTHTNY